MGDTRIDDSKPYVPPECDEETGVCGAVKKPEPEVSKPDPQVSHPGDDWQAPMLPPEKPAQMAQLAKNMSTPKPPTDSELRTSYEKMSDAELEREVNTLSKRLSGGDQYSGADVDKRKFHVAEAVAKARADAARPASEGEYWHDETSHYAGIATDRSPGVEAGFALRKKDDYSILDVSAHASLGHYGVQGTAAHAQVKKDIAGVDVTLSDDTLTAGMDAGSHNADGSWGVHGGGGAAIDSLELTLHRKDLGSVTLGVAAGQSVEYSVGLKVDGHEKEACVRASVSVFTLGACIPLGRI